MQERNVKMKRERFGWREKIPTNGKRQNYQKGTNWRHAKRMQTHRPTHGGENKTKFFSCSFFACFVFILLLVLIAEKMLLFLNFFLVLLLLPICRQFFFNFSKFSLKITYKRRDIHTHTYAQIYTTYCGIITFFCGLLDGIKNFSSVTI